MLEKQLETRTLPDFPKYLFREDGVVLSLRQRGGILRPTLRNGLHTVTLLSRTGTRSCSLAALICAAFHGPPPPRLCARFHDKNRLNCAASNLYYGIRPTRWKADHVRQSLAVSQLLSYSCRECGAALDVHDLAAVKGKRDRQCRYCREGLLADLAEHEQQATALALFGIPTHSPEVILEIAHLHAELFALARDVLKDREQAVLFSRFWEDRSLWEIGAPLDLTHERIRQIEERALGRLRAAMKGHRSRFPDSLDSTFSEEQYRGARTVPRAEAPEMPAPVDIVFTKEPEASKTTVDFEALASLLES